MSFELSAEQRCAVERWRDGDNVRVMAVPGAGKSKVILESCRISSARKTLILAYNRELCDETKARLKAMELEHVQCMTFHGMATLCVRPVHDDMALFQLLDDLEQTECDVEKVFAEQILIDECQDFRPSFLSLMGHLVDAPSDVQMMVVGDLPQLIYEYSKEDPASPAYLLSPSLYFPSTRPWSNIELTTSFRLTPHVAGFVGACFGRQIQSRKQGGPPVRVYTLSLWRAAPLVTSILQDVKSLEDCLLLVPYKKNNAPLKNLINHLSKHSIPVYIHGVDGQDERTRGGKLTISTWHASKGTERGTIIVFGVAASAKDNPLYVSLTRSQCNLHVLQDAQHPHPSIVGFFSERNQTTDGEGQLALADAHTLHCATLSKLPQKQPYHADRSVICLDDWRSPDRADWIRDVFDLEENCAWWDFDGEDDARVRSRANVDMAFPPLSSSCEDVSGVYRLSCVLQSEFRLTGTVKRLCEIEAPARVVYDQRAEHILKGSDARFVSPNTPDETLLSPRVRERLGSVFSGIGEDQKKWCYVASVCLAWNGFHHKHRQLLPFGWVNSSRVSSAFQWLIEVFKTFSGLKFDKRVCKMWNGTLLWCRCDVVDEESAFLCTWDASCLFDRGDVMTGIVRAALHDSNKCTIINIEKRVTRTIHVGAMKETVLTAILDSFDVV